MDSVKKTKRGRTSPSHALRASLEFIERVRDEYGDTTCAKEHVAAALGHKTLSGPSMVKIGSLTHFGLLSRVSGGGYQVSPLALRILMSIDNDDKRAALAEAACTPSLYSEIARNFAGKALPSQLGNILAHDYGVLEKSRDRTANNFRESMEYAEILRNGILHDSPATQDKSDDISLPNDAPPQHQEPIQSQAPSAPLTPKGADHQHHTIPLGLDGRMASIDLPTPTSARDLERIIAWAQFMKEMVYETP